MFGNGTASDKCSRILGGCARIHSVAPPVQCPLSRGRRGGCHLSWLSATHWINSWLRQQPLKFLGFEGHGYQVRDCLHPRDLVTLLEQQMSEQSRKCRITNVGGGIANSMSLAQLSDWCSARFGPREVLPDPTLRPFDIPWLVLDCQRASSEWNWRAQTPIVNVLEEIATHATNHPEWLEITAP